MTNKMLVRLPGNLKVDAEYKDFTIRTDQPVYSGGDNTAPAPFDLFLASLGTCSGIYVAFFCQQRKIPYEDITMEMFWERNEETRLPEKFRFEIHLTKDFPKKYIKALKKSVAQCAVKRLMDVGMDFEVISTVG